MKTGHISSAIRLDREFSHLLSALSEQMSGKKPLPIAANGLSGGALDAAAIEIGVVRLMWLGIPYFICGMQEIMVGTIRGMGASVAPMIISILGVCGIRIVWIFTIFALPQYHSMQSLYLSYSVSWVACIIGHFICFKILKNRLTKQLRQ